MSAPPETASGARPAAGLAALADRCVQCGLCLPHCPTYRLDRSEAESPRGRIQYVRAVASERLAPGPVGDAHLDHCLGCGRCEAACPAGVPYGELLVLARADQARRRPPGARVRGALALLARPRLLSALLALYRRLGTWLPAAWRPPVPRPPPAGRRFPALAPAGGQRLAVFTGCIARAYEGPAREALARLFAGAGIGLDWPAGQGCCGTAAAHAGDLASATRLAEANRLAFAGRPRVLSLASGCRQALARALGPDTGTVDALVALDALGDALVFRDAGGRRVALHLPCTQRTDPEASAALRRLLARVPGLVVADLPDTGCCGAAGLHQVAEPARAAALRAPLLEALAADAFDEVLSANIGCRLHLAGGTTIGVRHPVEFLAEHLA